MCSPDAFLGGPRPQLNHTLGNSCAVWEGNGGSNCIRLTEAQFQQRCGQWYRPCKPYQGAGLQSCHCPISTRKTKTVFLCPATVWKAQCYFHLSSPNNEKVTPMILCPDLPLTGIKSNQEVYPSTQKRNQLLASKGTQTLSFYLVPDGTRWCQWN